MSRADENCPTLGSVIEYYKAVIAGERLDAWQSTLADRLGIDRSLFLGVGSKLSAVELASLSPTLMTFEPVPDAKVPLELRLVHYGVKQVGLLHGSADRVNELGCWAMRRGLIAIRSPYEHVPRFDQGKGDTQT